MAGIKPKSYDEWSKLEEVIVGDIGYLDKYHFDLSFKAFFWDNVSSYLVSETFESLCKTSNSLHPYVEIPQKILEELSEDLSGFVRALQDFGATIRRPNNKFSTGSIETPNWKTIGSPALNVRDQTLVLGTNLIETAPHVRGRLFENDGLKEIFYDYFSSGANWVSMPRPTLANGQIDVSHFERDRDVIEKHLKSDEAKVGPLNRQEIVFDAAQCLRFGQDILINVANPSHRLGVDWLKRLFGSTFRFHTIEGLSEGHIDSMILPLKPGVLLVRSASIRDFLPKSLQSWDMVVAPEVENDLFPSYSGYSLQIASKFIDMNVLSLDEKTIIVNSLYPELVRKLEANGFTVIPAQHRHRRIFGGGFHCFTLDTVRRGGLETYF